MFTLENPIDFIKFASTNVFEILGNNEIEEERNNKQQLDNSIASFEENQDNEEFILFNEKDLGSDQYESENMFPTKEQSFPSEDFNLNSNCCSQTHTQVDFDGENPNMEDFIFKIRGEISAKGVNEVVCEALNIKHNDEFSLRSVELIKVKKRKTKDQIKQLEIEFAKNDDWSKEFMNKVSEKLNLEPSQVYKWHWDQISKKLGKAPKKQAKLQKQRNKRKRNSNTNNLKNKRARN